jgi:putative transposase
VRSLDGRELPLSTWERFSGLDPLSGRAYEQMLVGVATRRYARSLDPLGTGVKSRGTTSRAMSNYGTCPPHPEYSVTGGF